MEMPIWMRCGCPVSALMNKLRTVAHTQTSHDQPKQTGLWVLFMGVIFFISWESQHPKTKPPAHFGSGAVQPGPSGNGVLLNRQTR